NILAIFGGFCRGAFQWRPHSPMQRCGVLSALPAVHLDDRRWITLVRPSGACDVEASRVETSAHPSTTSTIGSRARVLSRDLRGAGSACHSRPPRGPHLGTHNLHHFLCPGPLHKPILLAPVLRN